MPEKWCFAETHNKNIFILIGTQVVVDSWQRPDYIGCIVYVRDGGRRTAALRLVFAAVYANGASALILGLLACQL